MSDGYTANMTFLASKIGELNAVAESVNSAVSMLECPGDLGPGDLNSAVQDLAAHWREGLQKTSEKIGDMAEGVQGSLSNYEAVEATAREAFHNNECPYLPPGNIVHSGPVLEPGSYA